MYRHNLFSSKFVENHLKLDYARMFLFGYRLKLAFTLCCTWATCKHGIHPDKNVLKSYLANPYKPAEFEDHENVQLRFTVPSILGDFTTFFGKLLLNLDPCGQNLQLKMLK